MEKEKFAMWWDFFKFVAGGYEELISLISKNISQVLARDIMESGIFTLTEEKMDVLYENLKKLLKPNIEHLLEIYTELSELRKKQQEIEKRIAELRKEIPPVTYTYSIKCPICGETISLSQPIALAIVALGKEVVCPKGHRFKITL